MTYCKGDASILEMSTIGDVIGFRHLSQRDIGNLALQLQPII